MNLFERLRRRRVSRFHPALRAALHAEAERLFPDPGTTRWPDRCTYPPCSAEDNWQCTGHSRKGRIVRLFTCSCFLVRTGRNSYERIPCDLHDPLLWAELERMVSE